jgi:propanol-preferring alcohol dehydrogenase
MHAMQLSRPATAEQHPLEPVDRPDPAPAPGELLLSVRACGVCRTDLQLIEGDLRAHRLPVVPGHQVVGTVAAVGDGVHGWNDGDRAGVTWLAGFDGTCRFCASGRENLCPNATFTGWDRDGGFATHVTVRADVAVPIPASFEDVEAAPLLCGGVIGYRALRLAGVPNLVASEDADGVVAPGGAPFRLGLYGFGASASLAIQVAVASGCRVHAASRSEGDLQRARDLGATSVGGYADAPPEPLDAAITFAPVGSVVLDALRAVDRGGTVVINAIHLDEIPAFPYALLWEERGLRSVANVTRRDATEFLRAAAEIPVRTRAHTYPLDDANAALADLKSGRIGAGAAVLVPGR